MGKLVQNMASGGGACDMTASSYGRTYSELKRQAENAMSREKDSYEKKVDFYRRQLKKKMNRISGTQRDLEKSMVAYSQRMRIINETRWSGKRQTPGGEKTRRLRLSSLPADGNASSRPLGQVEVPVSLLSGTDTRGSAVRSQPVRLAEGDRGPSVVNTYDLVDGNTSHSHGPYDRLLPSSPKKRADDFRRKAHDTEDNSYSPSGRETGSSHRGRDTVLPELFVQKCGREQSRHDPDTNYSSQNDTSNSTCTKTEEKDETDSSTETSSSDSGGSVTTGGNRTTIKTPRGKNKGSKLWRPRKGKKVRRSIDKMDTIVEEDGVMESRTSLRSRTSSRKFFFYKVTPPPDSQHDARHKLRAVVVGRNSDVFVRDHIEGTKEEKPKSNAEEKEDITKRTTTVIFPPLVGEVDEPLSFQGKAFWSPNDSLVRKKPAGPSAFLPFQSPKQTTIRASRRSKLKPVISEASL
uniref:Uncharacterized protein n=1 Tax=Branchiostoma floridae TaxID=7739 RepID=C3ZWF7_BRAFL|eukprot:XP_002587148.1 hypothetical protein BRAFLDRAFT_102237 [Branchiostoma floridae]